MINKVELNKNIKSKGEENLIWKMSSRAPTRYMRKFVYNMAYKSCVSFSLYIVNTQHLKTKGDSAKIKENLEDFIMNKKFSNKKKKRTESKRKLANEDYFYLEESLY